MKTLTLVRASIRGTTWFSTDGIRELARREKLWILPVAGFGIAVALGSFMFIIINFYNGFLAAGIMTGHPELLMLYAVVVGWVFIFILGIPLSLSVLYYSRDTRMLLTLPVRPSHIIGSKTLLLYLYSLPVNLFLLIPALVIYCGRFGVSLSFVAGGMIHLFISPLFPLALAILFVLALAKVVNLSRFRVALEVGGMGLALVLLVCFQVVLSRSMYSTAMERSVSLGGLPDFFSALARFIPPAGWAAEGFVESKAAVSSILSLLSTFGAFTIAMLLAPLNFLADVTERGEMKREKRTEEGGAALGALVPVRSVSMSLVKREWSIITSNSTFIFQLIGELIVLPLLLLIYALVLPKEILGQALGFISSSPLMGLIALAVLALMTNLSSLSSTSLSREGKLFSLSLTIPVSGRKQLGAKLALHMILLFTTYLVNLVVVFVVFRLPLPMLAFLLPAGPIFELYGFTTGIFFDLKRPILKWTHPQQAIKNNLNAMMAPAGIAVLLIALAIPSFFLIRAGIDPFLLGCLVPLVPLAMDVILLPRIFSYAEAQYGGGLEVET